DRTPARVSVQIHAGQAKCRRKKGGAGLAVRTERLAIQQQRGIKFPRSPTVQNGAQSRFVHLERGRKRRNVRRQIIITPTFRSRFGQPSSRRPMPGANESSTVE